MKHRRFGSTTRDVSIIGQGTWYIDRGHRASAIAALRRGIDLGMTHVDTAEYYGEAETIVGEAIAGRRDEVFLVSKVMPQNASRAGTLAACERSLQRLRTDRLDCYLLHWRGSYPLAETFAAFAALKASGKIVSFGVSNFDVADLEEAEAAAGKGEIACNQVLYHLQERAIEHSVLPWCETHKLPWSAIARSAMTISRAALGGRARARGDRGGAWRERTPSRARVSCTPRAALHHSEGEQSGTCG